MAYVYRHIRLDKNEPFYIGIGETKYRHTTKQNRNPIWGKIIAKTEYEVEILFNDVSWQFACQKEIEFIKLYGRIDRKTGTLANMTNGGDGNLGLIHSEESIKKITESSKGRPGHWKGKKMSDEFKAKISALKKGKPNYKLRGLVPSESAREAVRKHSTGNKYRLGKKHTEESKLKMSEGMKGRTSWLKGKKWPSHIPHPNTYRKLSEDSIKNFRLGQNPNPVIKYSLSGEFIKEYYSIGEAAEDNSGFVSGIWAAIKGKKVKTYKKFIWKYKS